MTIVRRTTFGPDGMPIDDDWTRRDVTVAPDNSNALRSFGEKPDLEAAMHIVQILATAVENETPLPQTLSDAQRNDLRSFLKEKFDADGDIVWRVVDPEIVGLRPRLSPELSTLVLDEIESSLEALSFFERLR